MDGRILLIVAGLAAVLVLAIVLGIARRRRDYVFLHTPEESSTATIPEILRAKHEPAESPSPSELAAFATPEPEPEPEPAPAPAVTEPEPAPAEPEPEPEPAPAVPAPTPEPAPAPTPVPAAAAAPEPEPPLDDHSFSMETPVEIWFGETRVGVRANTHTHRQFMKYADILLGDLKAAKADTR